MKTFACFVLGVGLFGLTSFALAAEDADQQKAVELQRYCRELGQLVEQHYPEATIAAFVDKKSKAEKIHFEYNIQTILMRYRDKDGSWQEPEFVRGPYVGGIWCDIVLHKGPYKGDIQGAEEGVTEAGPDFYTYLVAPYSKKLDQHITVKLRYPGGTPPEFLEHFYAMAKDFEPYMDKPKEK